MTLRRYTLVSDGSSDRVLLPILDWLLRSHSSQRFEGRWAELSVTPTIKSLEERIATAIKLFPCDLVFVHRDAERCSRSERVREIREALVGLGERSAVCVIPVRMTEAWLLFDEAALRRAAGNPQGVEALDLPFLRDLESLPDPKALLHSLLELASGLRGRRRSSFRPGPAVHRLVELVSDFSPLRSLAAFRELEADLLAVLTARAWAG